MNQREISAMVVTNRDRSAGEELLEICSDDYILDVSAVVTPDECLEFFTSPDRDQCPDLFVLGEDLSRSSREKIIESRKKVPRLRRRPLLLHNTTETTYGDKTVESLDRIHHVEHVIDTRQFRRILLDLQAFWYPEMTG